MSNHSLLNIQEITSRTYNHDPSVMETSIEHFQHHALTSEKTSHKKQVSPHIDFNGVINSLRHQNENHRKELMLLKSRLLQGQKAKGMNNQQQNYFKELLEQYNKKELQINQLKRNYFMAISNLKQTIQKNEILSKQVQRLSKKLKQSELNYSRQQQVFNKSQNLISNLSITKSNYEIQMVNLQDSLVILQKENQVINETNEQYEQKMALISQEVQRLRGMLEKYKKQNDNLKFNMEDRFIKIKKYENDFNDQRQIIERLRAEIREYNNRFASHNLQLRQNHQKLEYKENIIKDLKEMQQKLQLTLKQRNFKIKEAEAQLSMLDKSTKVFQDQISNERNAFQQQINMLKMRINEQYNNNKQIFAEKEELVMQFGFVRQENENLHKEVDRLGKQFQFEKGSISEQLRQIQEQRDIFLRENEHLIKEINNIHQVNQDINAHKNAIENDLNQIRQEMKHFEIKIKDMQQKYKYKLLETEQVVSKEWQNRMILVQESHNKQVSLLRNQLQGKEQRINEFREELNKKTEVISESKYEISNKNNEFNQIINEINHLRKQLGRAENELQMKNNDLQVKNVQLLNLRQGIKNQGLHSQSINKQNIGQLQQRIKIINELNIKIIDYQQIIDKFRRERDLFYQQKNSIGTIAQKNEKIIEIKNSQLKQYTNKTQELQNKVKQYQIQLQAKNFSLQSNAKYISDINFIITDLKLNLNHHQNKILLLTKEIQHNIQIIHEKQENFNVLSVKNKGLSQIILARQNQLSMSRVEKERISQNLIKVDDIKNDFNTFFKEIDRLNHVIIGKEHENSDLKNEIQLLIKKIQDISKQQIKIISIVQGISRNESSKQIQSVNNWKQIKQLIVTNNTTCIDNFRELHDQGNHISSHLKAEKAEQWRQRQQRIVRLTRELQVCMVRQKQYKLQIGKQQQIFLKLMQLNKENMAVKQEIIRMNHQHHHEIVAKTQSIIQLQNKIQSYENLQLRELEQTKSLFINKEQSLHNNILKLTQQKDVLANQNQSFLSQLHYKSQIITSLEHKISDITSMLNNKLQEFHQISLNLMSNQKEIQKYKQIIKSVHSKNSKNSELMNKVNMYQRQINKLQKIIEIRSEQNMKNEENYQQLRHEKKYLEQKHHPDKSIVQEINKLKLQNKTFSQQIHLLYSKLRQNENRLAYSKDQIINLNTQLQNILNHYQQQLKKLQYLDILQQQKNELILRINTLQDSFQVVNAKANQHELQNTYYKTISQQNKTFIYTYELKSHQIERQYVKLKQVYTNMNNEYSKLQMKNHQIQIDIKKAEMLNQKIQVLNGQINRLSQLNIELNEEISTCKLVLSDENMLQRRYEEQLILIVMLMAEIQNLRNRVQNQEIQLKTSRIMSINKYRN